MADLEQLKKDYAGLVIRSGLNIQKGQRLSITCPVECADFARLCAAEAYKAGCREVLMRWRDDELTRMKYLCAADEVFDSVNRWEVDYLDTLSEEGAAFLTIDADDPAGLSGVDPDRIKRAQISSGKALEAYRIDPFECKHLYEEYLKKYPKDYLSYTYYAAVLIELGESSAAEKILNKISKIVSSGKNNCPETIQKQLEENLFYNHLRLLSFQEKYEELHQLCIDNFKLIREMDLNQIFFYAKKKIGLLDPNLREKNSYIFRQIVEYHEDDFKNHIKKHLANEREEFDANVTAFNPDFPIEEVIEEVKKYIPSSKGLFVSLFDNTYTFKYDFCGKDDRCTVNFFKVVTFHNTNDIITMFPAQHCEYLPYVDLNYLIKTENNPKVKRLSQIEKFNKKFNKGS